MSNDASAQPANHPPPLSDGGRWTTDIPDGAVSVMSDGNNLILKASRPLQRRFEELLEKRKSASGLSADEEHQYEAICDLDEALSWLNRLSRQPSKG